MGFNVVIKDVFFGLFRIYVQFVIYLDLKSNICLIFDDVNENYLFVNVNDNYLFVIMN